MLNSNLLAFFITVVIATFWLRLNDFFASKGWVSSAISRKIIHIGTGPIFVLCWLLFKETPSAPFLAAIIPLAITVQFALVGTGVIKDPAAVDAMSRTGDRREILKGPLFYGFAFIIMTVAFWRRSPIGIVALMMLCGGDGLADLAGKFIKSAVLPWSQRKTVAGSLAVLIGGFLFAIFVMWIFIRHGYFNGSISKYLLPVGIIAIGSALIESLPFNDIDNITIPLLSVLLGFFVF